MIPFAAYAESEHRTALALHLTALLGAIPDWLVLAERAPRRSVSLRPGRGYLGWEIESGLSAAA